MTDTYTVSVPADLYEQCEKNIDGTTFESVDQYVQFVLSEVITHSDQRNAETSDDDISEEQLEALGYLDR